MSSENYPLRQSGIYRNLPTFDPSLKDLKAIICGASGISGFNALRSLLDSPERWSTIYTLSRSPIPEEQMAILTSSQQSRIKQVSVDFMSSGEDVAKTLKEAHVTADYVFFFSYLPPKETSAMDPSAEDELVKLNVPIFENLIHALPLAGITPKRILLQTGGKNYGVHIGRARTPIVESDPQPTHLSKNFYYRQEEILLNYCKQNPGTGWNVLRPFAVIGAVSTVSMNTFLPFAVYAAVQAEKKEPLVFGGDFEEWQFECCHSTARLTGYLAEWAVLEEKCENQAFNAQDGSPMSWDRFFEELARWYGVEKGVKGPELDEKRFESKSVVLKGGKEAPMGYGPPAAIKLSYTMGDWAKDEANPKVWKGLMEKSKGQLTTDIFESGYDIFMGDFAYQRIGIVSQNKVRRFGFSGFVDTIESVFETYQDMAKMGVVLAPKVDAARPMI